MPMTLCGEASAPPLVPELAVNSSTGLIPACRRVVAEELAPETIDLMHPLVQDGHDANVVIGEPPPVHEMSLVTEKEPFHAELSRNRS